MSITGNHKRIILGFLMLLTGFNSFAQVRDSLFKQGNISGFARTYFIATDNTEPLTDFYAQAIGGRFLAQTGSFHGFKLGLGIYHSTRIWGNVESRDSLSNKLSRYERALFDVQDPSNREVTLLGQLWLEYAGKGNQLKIGRMSLKTPLMNGQDGRMIPTLMQGIWWKNTQVARSTFQAAYIHAFAVRGSSRFYKVGQSMGVLGVGKNPNGTASGYRDHIQTAGLFIASAEYKHKQLELKLWDYFTENVFNTLYAEASWKQPLHKGNLQFSAQTVYQHGMGNGGSDTLNCRYIDPQAQALVLGGRIRYTLKGFQFSLNALRITSHGRFVFPREWGREGFFVYQRRERHEGTGDSYDVMLEVTKGFEQEALQGLKLKAGYGWSRRQAVDAYEFNKYGVPSYDHLNIEAKYALPGKLSGFEVEMIYIHKFQRGEADNWSNIINKVDASVYNLVVDYRF